MSDGKFPNPARSKMQSYPANKNVQKAAATEIPSKKRLSFDSPQSLVNSIYELKQTVYNLAQYVCNGGKSQRSTVAVSGGVRLRVIPAEPEDNAQDYLQGLQSRVQKLLHKIELRARLIETTDTADNKRTASVPKFITWKFPFFWAQVHMDPDPRHVVVVAPTESSAATRNTLESQFQVYRAISVHAQEVLESLRSGSIRQTDVLSELRTFFSLYDNLFTVPCCACGDLLKMESGCMLPPCIRTNSGAALHASCANHWP